MKKVPCQRADKAGLAAPGTGQAERVDRDYDLIVIGGECTFTGCMSSKTPAEAAAAVRKAVAAIAATGTAEVLIMDHITRT